MASHPSPFHRQRQSTKTLDPTGQTAKFLYTILKQLDLKNIDWNEVASSLDITNGHAARMRWSRFRAQIEGSENSYSRKSVKKGNGEKKRKKDYQEEQRINDRLPTDQQMSSKRLKTDPELGIKTETSGRLDFPDYSASFHTVKDEPSERISVINGVRVHHPTIETITVPPKPAEWPKATNWLDPTLASTSSGYGERTYVPAGYAYGAPLSRTTNQLQPQYSNMGLPYAPYQSAMRSNPYQGNLGMYNNQYQYSNLYAQPYQPKLPTSQQANLNQFQTQPSFTRNNSNQLNSNIPVSMPAATMSQQSPYPQRRPALAVQQTDALRTDPSTRTVPVTTDDDVKSGDQAQLQAETRALELAMEASYPWPHSESSIFHFSQQPPETNHNKANKSSGEDLGSQVAALNNSNNTTWNAENRYLNGATWSGDSGPGQCNLGQQASTTAGVESPHGFDESHGSSSYMDGSTKASATIGQEQRVIDLTEKIAESQPVIKSEPHS